MNLDTYIISLKWYSQVSYSAMYWYTEHQVYKTNQSRQQQTNNSHCRCSWWIWRRHRCMEQFQVPTDKLHIEKSRSLNLRYFCANIGPQQVQHFHEMRHNVHFSHHDWLMPTFKLLPKKKHQQHYFVCGSMTKINKQKKICKLFAHRKDYRVWRS